MMGEPSILTPATGPAKLSPSPIPMKALALPEEPPLTHLRIMRFSSSRDYPSP